MKKWLVLSLLVCVSFLAGCGGGSVSGPSGGAAKLPQIGQWTNTITTQMITYMDIKPNGDAFLVTTYQKSHPSVKQVDYMAKKSGDILTVSLAGTDLAMVHDPKTDTLAFDAGKFRRQTPEDAKKLEELKKQK